MIKMFTVVADYRPNNKSKPKYYVRAHNASEARRRFSANIPWLKIYDVFENTNPNINERNSIII